MQDNVEEKLLPKIHNIAELFSSGIKRKNSNDITGSHAMGKKSNVSDGNVDDNDSSCPLADGPCSAATLATITTENDEFLPSNENSLSS